MNTYKKWNIGLSIGMAIIAGGVWLYWEYACGGHKCSLQLLDWTLDPLLWSSIPLAIIFTTLLFFPSKLFERFLFHIFSWSIPISLLMILNTDPRSSNILSFDRGQVAWLLGSIIFLITILYAIGWHIYEWRKGRIAGDAFARLSVFLISGAIFYAIWQLF